MGTLPFVDLKAQYRRLRPQIDEAIQHVLDDGQYVMGPHLERFEGELAVFAGARHAIGVSSGTDALFISLLAYGIGRGDAVFVPAFTYTASAEVIALAGARPVFVDVEPETFNIDTADLEAKIAAVKEQGELSPKGVLAVDLFGLPADWDTLNDIAKANDLVLISDAAQSFGGEYGCKRVGTLATVTGTSFYPSKPLGCYGDGGAILTDDDDIAATIISIRTHGTGVHKYDVVRVGLNGRLDAIQAAVLSVKLSVFAEELDARETIAGLYDEGLADIVQVPKRLPDYRSAWAQYTIKTEGRDELRAKLAEAGIPSTAFYPKPLHFHPPYAPFGNGPGSLPVSEELCGRVLSLPMHPYMATSDVQRVIDGVRAAVG